MENRKINYIEFKSKDIESTKAFYSTVLGWEFVDYGPTYTAFTAPSAGIDGGFELSENQIQNGALVVLYHDDLESIRDQIQSYPATISLDIFSFPGGRRFHFLDPSGNELAIWSDK